MCLQTGAVEKLHNNKFSIVDETSDLTNDKWMMFLVRYIDSQTLNVRTELLELIHLNASDYNIEKLFTSRNAEKKFHFQTFLLFPMIIYYDAFVMRKII